MAGSLLSFACQLPGSDQQAGLQVAVGMLVPWGHHLKPYVLQVYTIWNYRREALQPVLSAGGDAASAASQAELALTQVWPGHCSTSTLVSQQSFPARLQTGLLRASSAGCASRASDCQMLHVVQRRMFAVQEQDQHLLHLLQFMHREPCI